MVDAPMKGSVAAVMAALISVALLVEGSALLLLHGEALSGWCAAAQVLVHVCVAKVENSSNSILKAAQSYSDSTLHCVFRLLS